MFVSPEAGLKFWRLRIEKCDPQLLASAAELVASGDVVWDVGANLGLFSFAAAGLAGPAGRVLAIEPDSWLVSLLRRSAAANSNRIAPVDVIPTAVSDSVDFKRFHIARRTRAMNYLDGFGLTEPGESREEQLVPTVTLDWILERFPAPKVLKIDVEGAEAQVVRGGKRMFSEIQPAVICEVARESQSFITECLRDYGYILFDAQCLKGERKPVAAAAWNTLALPKGHRLLGAIA